MKCMLITCFLLMASCGMGDSKRTGKLPPFFAAYPFEYVVTPEPVALTSSLEELADEQANCGEVWLDKLNKASGAVQGGLPDALKSGAEKALSMAEYSYLLGLFYNCNLREQAAEDGVKLIEDSDDSIKYEAAVIGEGDKRLDFTRFVTWSEHKNEQGEVPSSDGEADKIDGFMANLYLQEDKTRTQTRIELSKKEALRHITSLSWSDAPQQHEVALRGELVEYDRGADKEQLLSLRYYGEHVSATSIWMMLAHMKADGSAILLASCDINDTENFNKSCAASEFDFYHLDAKGDTVCSSKEDTDCSASDFKSTLDDFLTNSEAKWAHGDYAKDKLDPRRPFFAGEGDLAAKRVKIFTASVPGTPTPAKDQEDDDGEE